MLSLPLGVVPIKRFAERHGRALNAVLAGTAELMLLRGVLLAAGIVRAGENAATGACSRMAGTATYGLTEACSRVATRGSHCARQCEGVEGVCVFGVDDEEWGQVVAAALVGSARVELVAKQLGERVASYKCPTLYCDLPVLKLNGVGEVDRAATARVAAAMLSAV